MSLQLWIPFATATLAFACMPGPAILYMTSQTLAHGRRAGLKAALGIHLGCYAHIAAATFGLSALLHAAPMAFDVIRLAGAGYLIWLGGSMIVKSRHAADADPEHKPGVLRDSVVVEVLNPKTALFFLTFLPQFVDVTASAPVWLQFLVLGSFVNLVFSFADVAAVLGASVLLGPLSSPRFKRFVPRLSGSILMGLGCVLVLQDGFN
ncbi:Threonine/homoserine/homoserine lactone efflux protein [Pseudomonas sp. ok272]|uniref:LysE family translocator n=1 Tax=unclassified Pseudomonas TaxID=196821 RepID=UPI0008CAC7CA|nr:MULTISPECIES: LysE family translocator [unclassified Pseudomonas]SEN45121.1 Threonine/homoserine/homoserine lactone efflux protein [Pseudomonas sp. ok272]SFM81129.1 Threonine/homoserine/homoserine lactone efflux protein [Pseudomonas sp. ok602]